MHTHITKGLRRRPICSKIVELGSWHHKSALLMCWDNSSTLHPHVCKSHISDVQLERGASPALAVTQSASSVCSALPQA